MLRCIGPAQRLAWLGQHEQLLLGCDRTQQQADHAGKLLVVERLTPRYIEHLRLVASWQPGNLPRR